MNVNIIIEYQTDLSDNFLDAIKNNIIDFSTFNEFKDVNTEKNSVG